ncbi:LuxR C-terminal-related transcriptional regulator [Occallatibacter riparius]|uniref:Response regulator transcription factor n=1 Tax=Occallatibacter riparius TaxID=1002689 RepID=A0A9J7BRN3_9BACT|nr:response regulator transcription factor [Occallatibacter riparius]UWZ85231.1 response regulator transcription factor [Occallatibacter riparius]
MKVAGLLVVSDESIPRVALRHWLSSVPGIEILGDTTAKKALHLALETGAQVIVYHVPHITNHVLVTIVAIRKGLPEAGIVVLSRETSPLLVKSAFSAGATAYLLLSSAPTDLISGIRAALNGRRLLDPDLSEGLLDALLGRSDSASTPLSEREQQVLLLRSLGHSAREIGAALRISTKSVETYYTRIREKLNLRTRAEMVRYALERGILRPKGQQ